MFYSLVFEFEPYFYCNFRSCCSFSTTCHKSQCNESTNKESKLILQLWHWGSNGVSRTIHYIVLGIATSNGKYIKLLFPQLLCTSQLYLLAILGCQLKDFHKQNTFIGFNPNPTIRFCSFNAPRCWFILIVWQKSHAMQEFRQLLINTY